MTDLLGQQYGSYRLQRLIGQGGFADVYLGEHIHLHTQAAIKILQMRVAEKNTDLFVNEARTIAHLIHHHIIRVLDFGIEDTVPFLVMDYAPKGTLRQRYPRGTSVDPLIVASHVKQIASALQYAHDKKLIHRDIKPENLLLNANEDVLLSDFGLVIIAQSSASRTTKEMAGTVPYMAPEQLQGKPRQASDQYSLGIVIYEWLTGVLPFQGSFIEVASQHLLTPPPSIPEKVPSISPRLAEVVMKALKKQPEERFPTLQAFAAAFVEESQSNDNQVIAISSVNKRTEMKILQEHPMQSVVSQAIPDADAMSTVVREIDDPSTALTFIKASANITPSVIQKHTDKIEISTVFKENDLPHLQRKIISQTDEPSKNLSNIPPQKRQKHPLLLAMSIFLLITILAGTLYISLQILGVVPGAFSGLSASVKFEPQVQPVHQQFQIKGLYGKKVLDAAKATLPVKDLKVSKVGTLSGMTSGYTGCTLGVLNCQRAVSSYDVTTLADQLRPRLEDQITQEIQKQLTADSIQIVDIFFEGDSMVANPSIAAISKTVQVTITETGTVAIISRSDLQELCTQLLLQQVQKPNVTYDMLNVRTQIDKTHIQTLTDPGWNIPVTADGIAESHFSSVQLRAIQQHLAGLTVDTARAWLQQQSSINPKTIKIKTLGTGNILSKDEQEIDVSIISPTLPQPTITSIPTSQITTTPAATLQPAITPTPKN